MLRLPNAPAKWSQNEEAQFRRALEQYAQQNDAALGNLNAVQLNKSLAPSPLFLGSSSAFQTGASISLPAGTLRSRGGLRVTGFWEYVNNQASGTPAPFLQFLLGGVSVLQYIAASVPIGGAPRVIGLEWNIVPYGGSAQRQAHMVRLLDGAGSATWSTLAVDLFSQGPVARAGLARSAVDMTQGQTIALTTQVNSATASFSMQFVGGTLELLPGTV